MTNSRARLVLLALALMAANCRNTGNVPHPGQPLLTASPNPVPPEFWSGPGATTIRWSTGDGSQGRVVVSTDDGPDQLFASSSAGEQAASWIVTGSTYRFRLESAGSPPRSLASLDVTRRSDAFTALALVVVGLLAGLLALRVVPPVRRASWLLEAGFLGVVLAPLWVKLVQLSTDLRFFKRAEPDRVVVSATLAVLLLVWAALPLLERRTRAMLAVAVSLILTSIGTADLIHMRFFGTVIGMSELGAATGLPGITSSIMALVQWRDARYYIDCLAAVAGCIAYVRLCRHTDPLVRSDRRALSVGLLIVSVAAIVPTVRLVAADSEVFWDTWANREMVGRVGLLPFHMYDAVSHAAGRISEPKVGEAERREVAGQLAAWKSAQRGRSPLFGAAHGRNVILINAESLFAFPIGLRIDGQPVMPHFEELMGESLSFPNYFDEAYLGQSSDAELLALESLYPLRDSAYALRYPTRTPYGLPAILVGQRYSTLSATGTSAEIWDMNLRHPRERFERSYFDPAFPGTEHFNGAVADRQFFEQMAAHLESQPQPFMAFLMSASTHVPYDVPAAHRSMRVGHLEGTFVGRYLQAVNYFDSALGEFVDTLRSTGLLDESVFVIYGDHRAYLDDLKPVATLLNIDPDDVVRMWRARSTLPLLIRLPHGEHAGPRTVSGGHLDIAPTILSLLGIEEPRAAMLGRDLTNASAGFAVFHDGSFTDGRSLFLARGGTNNGPAACYEMAAGTRISCDTIESLHRDALERLRVSDLIVRGDLIPSLTGIAPWSPDRR